MELKDYFGAAEAFDKAFELYAELPVYLRPWRVNWYQTGPYEAYYFTGRYRDVINLANQTLDSVTEDALPETLLWRGRANLELGDQQTAIDDFRQALQWHPHWQPAEDELQKLGEEP